MSTPVRDESVERPPLVLDGSYGEGGGQILRTALSLSLLTGRPVELRKIRAGRPRPGLQPQHLKAVEAAARISGSSVEGASLGSSRLLFRPRPARPGSYQVDIGTAGSTSLVLQTVVYPLAFCSHPSVLTLSGGTHVPWAPCFDYLQLHWCTFLRRMGIQVELALVRAGFYPRGGGQIHARIEPTRTVQPLSLLRRGTLQRVIVLSAVGQLPLEIAQRQARQARQRLEPLGAPVETQIRQLPAGSPGSFLLLLARFTESQFCAAALGERGKPAERVADEAVDALLSFLATEAAVDEHLADQLVIPMALACGRSELAIARITPHLLTNLWVVQQFLCCRVEVIGQPGQPGRVCLEAVGKPLGPTQEELCKPTSGPT